ncbi:hypothetical protein EV182_006672, partial [Spiromyces aspiralis]
MYPAIPEFTPISVSGVDAPAAQSQFNLDPTGIQPQIVTPPNGVRSMASRPNIARQQLYGPETPAMADPLAMQRTILSLLQARQMGLQCRAAPDSNDDGDSSQALEVEDLVDSEHIDAIPTSREDGRDKGGEEEEKGEEEIGSKEAVSSVASTPDEDQRAMASQYMSSRDLNELFPSLGEIEIEERSLIITEPLIREMTLVRAGAGRAHGVRAAGIPANRTPVQPVSYLETIREVAKKSVGGNEHDQRRILPHKPIGNPPKADCDVTTNPKDDVVDKIAIMLNRINYL